MMKRSLGSVESTVSGPPDIVDVSHRLWYCLTRPSPPLLDIYENLKLLESNSYQLAKSLVVDRAGFKILADLFQDAASEKQLLGCYLLQLVQRHELSRPSITSELENVWQKNLLFCLQAIMHIYKVSIGR
jgi:hypothetical protein